MKGKRRRGKPRTAGAPGGEVVVYEAPGGEVRVDVRLERESVWLSLSQMAELFGRDKSVISRHLKNVFESGEPDREATVAKNATVQREGDRDVLREVEFFNLDGILSVGYRVNSKRGTPVFDGVRFPAGPRMAKTRESVRRACADAPRSGLSGGTAYPLDLRS
jgi:hypothetical protein